MLNFNELELPKMALIICFTKVDYEKAYQQVIASGLAGANVWLMQKDTKLSDDIYNYPFLFVVGNNSVINQSASFEKLEEYIAERSTLCVYTNMERGANKSRDESVTLKNAIQFEQSNWVELLRILLLIMRFDGEIDMDFHDFRSILRSAKKIRSVSLTFNGPENSINEQLKVQLEEPSCKLHSNSKIVVMIEASKEAGMSDLMQIITSIEEHIAPEEFAYTYRINEGVKERINLYVVETID